MPSIYDYLDYRGYLRDAYTHAKSRSPKYSYRFFAKKANCFLVAGCALQGALGSTKMVEPSFLAVSSAMTIA